MNNNTNLNNSQKSNNEIDLREVLGVLWLNKMLLTSVTTFFGLSALIFSLFLPNIYKSEALLYPVGEQNDMSSSMRGVGGFASLAGINLGSTSTGDNSLKALDKLTTLSFFTDHILPNIFLPDLMAIDSWDASTNVITYDDNFYDETNQSWVRDFKFPKTQVPSAQESYMVFIDDHLSVSLDSETFFVTISIKHQSPFIAHEWTELVVEEINKFFSVKDKAEAQAAVDYLNGEIAKTSLTEIKESIAELLQKKTQQLTLIEVSDFYVYDYLDRPAVMERKAEPRRLLILIIGALFGTIISIFIILVKQYIINKKLY